MSIVPQGGNTRDFVLDLEGVLADGQVINLLIGSEGTLRVIDDVLIATSEAQAKELWMVRENISEAQQHDGGNIKHDIAVPVSSVPAFIDEVLPLLHAAYAGVRPIVYGHLGTATCTSTSPAQPA